MHILTRTVEISSKFEKKDFLFASDLHIGSGFLDEERLDSDLREALKREARININGDVFDGHNHKHKYYRPGSMHPRLEQSTKPYNTALDMAVERLAPVAHLIDGLGTGNHDDNMAKWNGVDMVDLLIGELNRHHGANIEYMGYSGWLVYRFSHSTSQQSLKIQYHHGAGGAAPVTKGAISFARADMWIDDADIVWRGHNHQLQAGRSVRQGLDRDNRVREYSRLAVRSGSYLTTYSMQDEADRKKRGRVASYGEDWDCAPLPKGGVFMTARYDKSASQIDFRAEI